MTRPPATLPPSTQEPASLAHVLLRLGPPALLLLVPVGGLLLGASVFGMPPGLRLAAAAMFVLGLALLGVLARGEWRARRR